MFPVALLRSLRQDNSRKKKSQVHVETEWTDLHQIRTSVPFKRDPLQQLQQTTTDFSLSPRATRTARSIKPKKMSTRVSNFSDLIQRVTANCFLHPLSATRHHPDQISDTDDSSVDGEKYKTESESEEEEERLDGGELSGGIRAWKNGEKTKQTDDSSSKVMMEMVMLMGEVFEAVSAAKRAYVKMQGAQSPWDPERVRAADAAVVAELRRLGVLRERFRRSCITGRELVGSGGDGGRRGRVGVGGVLTVREVVAPYEAAVEELKGEVRVKEKEIESLREKLKTAAASSNGGGKKGRSSSQSKRKVSCSSQAFHVTPAPELFETTMASVIEACKSFTSLLLSLMRSAHWDISAAVRSIESATTPSAAADFNTTTSSSLVGPHHAKYALESYISRKIFQGFDHETFYMDGSLSSLLHPDQFRQDCFTQYKDMKSMDPIELLGILPTCHFGKFCSKKYLSIVHPKMEESLFGDLEQRRQVVGGTHPRSQFYGEFTRLAKAVWLLHLLAFALDPPPSHFEASAGAEFNSEYMDSVVRNSKGGGGVGQVVGFGLSPGFKLGNNIGSVIKARVYLVPRK